MNELKKMEQLLLQQQAAHARETALLRDQVYWLLARADLTNALLMPLLLDAGTALQTKAIAAAQVKGEELLEKGPPEIAAHYARLLAGIAPTPARDG